MKSQITIRDWSESDRPREKLASKGAHALTDAELLAIIIGSGSRTESALGLSRRLLKNAHDKLHVLGDYALEELIKYKGIGHAKAISIQAAMELGRRRVIQESSENSETIDASSKAFQVFVKYLQGLDHEEFWYMILNQANNILEVERLSMGGINQTVIDIRLLMRRVLLRKGTGLIVAHNHPSGSIRPSQPDIKITTEIKEACSYLKLKLYDHIIVGRDKYFSFADEGMI